jgi:hypothetical protein
MQVCAVASNIAIRHREQSFRGHQDVQDMRRSCAHHRSPSPASEFSGVLEISIVF